mmetsp:Transcript_11907/g.25743  ORF Transcript_11907/g.25743 Transcript_11907/m.25743 type:complete len:274 (+) Transcript_11907:79-900(+)
MRMFKNLRRYNRTEQQTSKGKVLSKEENTLHHSISEQDWDKVDRLLLSDNNKSMQDFIELSSSISSTVATTTIDDLVLHHACRYHAPLAIMSKLSTNFPSSIDTSDGTGRYPIHLAVASGCKPSVIRFLIQTNPTSAGLQDNSGKTPIHYAGECYTKTLIDDCFGFQDLDKLHRDTLLVAKLLLEAAPHSVNVEDKDEMNPIEYALLNSTHSKVIKRMQRASSEDWKKRKMEEQNNVRDIPSPMDQSFYLSTMSEFTQRHSCHHRLGAALHEQ